MKKDNSTFRQKVTLRQQMLKRMAETPVIMETHGGAGKLYRACYSHVEQGVVFEKQDAKAATLARQRPTWAVYQADCVGAIAEGIGKHWPVNVLDVDPYGEPWPVIEAFFTSERPRPETMFVVVNDGLRQKIKIGGAWNVKSLEGVVSKFGNGLYGKYLDVCRFLMEKHAAQAGYTVSRFAGYYCGYLDQMTHYLAELKQG